MNIITKKHIFKQKLKGDRVEIWTSELNKRGVQILLDCGVWDLDEAGSDKFWHEYSFTVRYPIKLIDTDGDGEIENWICLDPGDHHLQCITDNDIVSMFRSIF